METLDRIREAQFKSAIPEALELRTILYIGAKPARMQILPIFFGNGRVIDVLEAWPANIDALIGLNEKSKVFRRIFLGDVRKAEILESYELVLFWHGPEHLAIQDLPFVLAKLEAAATRLVVLASPWGRYSQGATEGNPFERHRSSLYPEDLAGFGYQTAVHGERDRKGSNLIAWKWIRK
jgi:hypothetical protein